MQFSVLNTNFVPIEIVDTFESCIWTDRFCGYGDFEIVMSPTIKMIDLMQPDRYLSIEESEHLMIIEGLDIKTDVEDGAKLIVKGRSLESILDRRVIWEKTVLSQTLPVAIQTLLNDNIMAAGIGSPRNIPGFYMWSESNPDIDNLTVEAQYAEGDSLYLAILDICMSARIGFKILLDIYQGFKFTLHSGKNRSYSQILNPYVVFSPEFENVITGDYSEDKSFLKTVTLIAGEAGVENLRKKTVVELPSGGGSGLSRREMYTNASGITKTVGDVTLTDQEYEDQLTRKGLEDLNRNPFIKTFEGQVDTSNIYKYGEDFFMGDILQIVDEFGHSTYSQVTALIRSQDLSGIKVYPTFTTI